jgi:hypothetical protein
MSFSFPFFASFYPLVSPSFLLYSFFTPLEGGGAWFPYQQRYQLILPYITHHLPKIGAFMSSRKKQHVSPSSGTYLHEKITSHPNTPSYSYLDKGWPARTASRAALLGIIKAKNTFFLPSKNVR